MHALRLSIANPSARRICQARRVSIANPSALRVQIVALWIQGVADAKRAVAADLDSKSKHCLVQTLSVAVLLLEAISDSFVNHKRAIGKQRSRDVQLEQVLAIDGLFFALNLEHCVRCHVGKTRPTRQSMYDSPLSSKTKLLLLRFIESESLAERARRRRASIANPKSAA